jgi:hypothetical protein
MGEPHEIREKNETLATHIVVPMGRATEKHRVYRENNLLIFFYKKINLKRNR